MAKSILNQTVDFKYHEPAAETNFAEFKKVVESRRSVRVYLQEQPSDEIINECLRLALLAPNSSNLQTTDFYVVQNSDLKEKLSVACMNQSAVRTAPLLIVCVARPYQWKSSADQMLRVFDEMGEKREIVRSYYSKLVHFYYGTGPFGLLTILKKIIIPISGLFKVVPRGPFGHSGLKLWANKSAALACENLMLAFRAAGYDTCPMEGFDEYRVKKLFSLGCKESICMVISVGKRADNGVYGPQIRFPLNQFVRYYR